MGANCHGFDMADTVVKGLSNEAIARRWKLNGVDRGREDTRFTQVRLLTIEVKAYVLLDCIALDLDYRDASSLT